MTDSSSPRTDTPVGAAMAIGTPLRHETARPVRYVSNVEVYEQWAEVSHGFVLSSRFHMILSMLYSLITKGKQEITGL
jgi:hypothetical protein